MKQATAFMLACYGQSQYRSMIEARLKVWTSKVGRNICGAPLLLQMKNVARAHVHASGYLEAYLDADPPSLQPCNFTRVGKRWFKQSNAPGDTHWLLCSCMMMMMMTN